jgi:lipoprotein-anchoring transpeptidase ErfK/SrfK
VKNPLYSIKPDDKNPAMIYSSNISRRQFVSGSASLSGLALAGCARTVTIDNPAIPAISRNYALMYGAMPAERFPVPAVNLRKVPAKYYRRLVKYSTTEPVGSLVVETGNFYLYLVMEGGMALRYGVGLGPAGFEWAGRARIGWKQQWPKWTPPDEMIARLPELQKYSAKNGGMPPALDNPLGARALYIFKGSKDTLYRLHGTQESWSIGKAVSSGCVRLLNQDIIDLYDRVPTNSPVLVT